MEPALDVYPRIEKIPWLSTIGQQPRPQFGFPVAFVESRERALSGFHSDLWADAKTEAQGDLTEYLSRRHPTFYNGQWNPLAKQSRNLVERALGETLVLALAQKGFAAEMGPPIVLDLNRAAVEIAYRRKFRNAPTFFEALLAIYEAGRLPCGWEGNLKDWPNGTVMVH